MDGLIEALADLRGDDFARHYAYNMAVGMYGDDPEPDEAQIIAIVHEGALYSLSISDSYAIERDADFVGMTISAVILDAFRAWREDRDRIYAAARRRIDDGSVDVIAQMELEIEQQRQQPVSVVVE